MTPQQVAESYNQLANQWRDVGTHGFAAVHRAIAMVSQRGIALDVGCGTGRLMPLLASAGFEFEGIDGSPAMVALARTRYPDARILHADICAWKIPRTYDLVVAWDSLWHVPLQRHITVLTKLCNGLSAGGVFLFTMGGTDVPEEKHDACMGPPMYHATLGVPQTLQAIFAAGCGVRHLEYDQWPESHVHVIAQKIQPE